MTVHVRSAKIVAFEQQRCFRDLCHGIGKAVTHIESGRMTALAKTLQCLLGRTVMLSIESNGCDVWRLGKTSDDLSRIRKPLGSLDCSCLE